MVLPLLVSTSSRSPAVSFPVFVLDGIMWGVSWGVLELYRVPLARVSWRIPLLAAVSLLLCGRMAVRWRVNHLVPTSRSSTQTGLLLCQHAGIGSVFGDDGGCIVGGLLWRISGR